MGSVSAYAPPREAKAGKTFDKLEPCASHSACMERNMKASDQLLLRTKVHYCAKRDLDYMDETT